MIHVIPTSDIKEHHYNTHCHCNPKLVMESGSMIVVHNSFDEREILEALLPEYLDQLQLKGWDVYEM